MTERISALRRRMIEDMNARGLSLGSQRAHIRSCKRFAAFLKRSPDSATREDIRRFQLHLAEEKVSIGTRNAVMSGVKFLFRVTLRRLDLAEEIYHLNEPQRVPVILSVPHHQVLGGQAAACRRPATQGQGDAEHHLWHRHACQRSDQAQGR